MPNQTDRKNDQNALINMARQRRVDVDAFDPFAPRTVIRGESFSTPLNSLPSSFLVQPVFPLQIWII